MVACVRISDFISYGIVTNDSVHSNLFLLHTYMVRMLGSCQVPDAIWFESLNRLFYARWNLRGTKCDFRCASLIWSNTKSLSTPQNHLLNHVGKLGYQMKIAVLSSRKSRQYGEL